MHKIIRSYLQQFISEQEISNLGEDVQFEQFVNFCLLSKYYPEQFEVESITTMSKDDDSIDGAAILIDDNLVLTIDDAKRIFENLSRRRSVRVEYLFFQAKRSEGFDAGEILKFGTSISRLLENDEYCPSDDVLGEIKEIHNLVVESLEKVENGRPTLLLHYACTGNWNNGNNLQKQLDFCTGNLKNTGLFYQIDFLPIDREKLIESWNYTRSPVEATFDFRGSTLPFPPIDQVEDAFSL